MSKAYLYFALLTIALVGINSNPTSAPDGKVKAIDEVFQRLETLAGRTLGKLYNKIDSLTLLTKQLLRQTKSRSPNISEGVRGDMSSRCQQGFRAVPGDRMCYYLSTYKQPWYLAREHCLQLGSDVEMLSIMTTKMQFTVSHLIQTDPEAKLIKKWWTAGRTSGSNWYWVKRIALQGFFGKFWANEDSASETRADRNSCVVLDADYYYRWKKVKCLSKHQHKRKHYAKSESPSYHFICQQPALKLESLQIPSDLVSKIISEQSSETKP